MVLRAIYRSASVPLTMRMRALPFERPKLAAVLTASLSGEEFGNQLEAARKRLVEGARPSSGPMVIKHPPRPELPK
jgi:hypothetical protein